MPYIRTKSLKLFFPTVKTLVLFFALTGIAQESIFAGTPLYNADHMFAFADHSYQQNHYDTAISEFERFMYFYPDDARMEEAMFKTGMCHFRRDRYDSAVKVFDRLIWQYGSSDHAIEAVFMAAESDMRRNDVRGALARLRALTHERFDPAVKDRAFYRMGWLFLKKQDTAPARRAFDEISEARKHIYRTEDLLHRLDNLRDVPAKSPFAAGILAIIPGGGYLYTERYQDALISFVFIGVGAGASYESFDNDLNIIGVIAAMVTAGFYSGSAYGSVGAAHKYNRMVYEDFIMDLRHNRPEPTGPIPALGLKLEKNAAALTLGFSF